MEQPLLINHPNEEYINSSVALVSSLYEGNMYRQYIGYVDQVIENHTRFSDYNEMPYYLMNGTTNSLYGLDVGWKTDMLLGMNKWFAMYHLFQITTHDKLVFVDYDSAFLKNEKIDTFEPGVTGLSPIHGSPYYDSVFLLLYCMYTGMSYESLIEHTDSSKYNSGFMIIDRSFFDKIQLDKFVDFAVDIHERKAMGERSWVSMHNFDYGNINDTTSTTLTPFDEVWLMHHVASIGANSIRNIDQRYNVNNIDRVVDGETVHVHFCTDKSQFFEFYETTTHKEIFTNINKLKAWKDKEDTPVSGDGSRPENCAKFVEWFNNFLVDNNIHTMVDYGCGDGEMWGGMVPKVKNYIGVEIVDELRELRHRNWPSSTFVEKLPEEMKGDVILIKDILIHWKDHEIHKFIKSLRGRFDYIILVEWHDETITDRYSEIDNWRFCPIDLNKIFGDRYTIVQEDVAPIAKTVAIVRGH